MFVVHNDFYEVFYFRPAKIRGGYNRGWRKLFAVRSNLHRDAVLNLDFDSKISGITSGKVKAVVTGLENSLAVTFDAVEGDLNFTASVVDEAFIVTGNELGYMLSSDSVTMSLVKVEDSEGVQKKIFS